MKVKAKRSFNYRNDSLHAESVLMQCISNSGVRSHTVGAHRAATVRAITPKA